MKPPRVSWLRRGAFLLGFGLLFVTSNASAYCRTTTCDPDASCSTAPADCCIYDSQGCEINGEPIAWPTSCVSFNVDEQGSALREVSAKQLSDILNGAYDEWLSADCDAGGPISIALENRGESQCSPGEYNLNPGDRNANIWMFLDEAEGSDGAEIEGNFGLDAATLGVSIVSYNPGTAEIYDVDVQLNSSVAAFTMTDGREGAQVDLLSVVTHEAGHFLGLDHSKVPGATMGPGYNPGTIDARDLSADDIAGICSVYPDHRIIREENQTCEPRGEYSPKCEGAGCDCGLARQARGGLPSRAPWLAAAALGALWLRRRAVATSKRARVNDV